MYVCKVWLDGLAGKDVPAKGMFLVDEQGACDRRSSQGSGGNAKQLSAKHRRETQRMNKGVYSADDVSNLFFFFFFSSPCSVVAKGSRCAGELVDLGVAPGGGELIPLY